MVEKIKTKLADSEILIELTLQMKRCIQQRITEEKTLGYAELLRELREEPNHFFFPDLPRRLWQNYQYLVIKLVRKFPQSNESNIQAFMENFGKHYLVLQIETIFLNYMEKLHPIYPNSGGLFVFIDFDADLHTAGKYADKGFRFMIQIWESILWKINASKIKDPELCALISHYELIHYFELWTDYFLENFKTNLCKWETRKKSEEKNHEP